jgi:uncharacterized protein (TIGR02246 family)
VGTSRRCGTRATGDRSAIAAVVRDLVEAWNRADADGFSGAFANSATYVTGAGEEVRGRAAIAGLVRQAGAGVEIVGRVQVECSGAAGEACFRWTSSGRRQGAARSGTITCALAREGRTWLIRRLTNEKQRAAANLPRTRPNRRRRA